MNTLRVCDLPRPSAPRMTRLAPARITRSEWTKFRTLRSTGFALVAALSMLIGFGIAASFATVHDWATMSAKDRASFDPLLTSLRGVDGAQLALGVLGVLWISGEYGTGLIRSTFAAVPKRLPVLWSKAAVLATVVFLLALPGTLIVFFASQSILQGKHISLAFTHPEVARALIGAALYLTLVALFSLGLGAVIRNTAGGIAALVSIVFVIPTLISVFGTSWKNAINPYLPTNAGAAITSIHQQANTLAPWTGFGLFLGYTAALLAVAAILLRRRDA
jgi:hypothetical protein